MANLKKQPTNSEWKDALHSPNKLLKTIDSLTKAKLTLKIYNCYFNIIKTIIRFTEHF